MIIQNEESEVKMHGTLDTVNFEIKTDDGKMFHILSNLYSNPFGAVVRELSTNCMDGHKINNTPDKPFDIILPGRFDMGKFITFRDYGPGMPHDVVMSIFTTFGQSTKAGSNTETGCLGLGSKSPLAITDSFTVTSINEGMKTVYSVSKDKQRKPVLAMFGSSETDEPNGLMVTVPLTDQYMSKVNYEINEQLKWFNIKPNIYKGEKLVEDYQWDDTRNEYFELTPEIFVKAEKHKKNSQIIQGEIGYAFNEDTLINMFSINEDVPFLEYTDKMEINSASHAVLEKFFSQYESLIFMPMGTVTFAPSREELIYDEPTARNILKEFFSAIKLISDNYQKVYDNIENMYQFRQMKNHSYSLDKIIDIDVDTKNFIKKIGFGFEANLKELKLVLKDGTNPAGRRLEKLSTLSYYKDILEFRCLHYQRWNNEITPINMIRRKKGGWRDSGEWIKTTEDISDYVSNHDYRTIHIVFVNPDTKFYKKHITNYAIQKNIEIDKTVNKTAEDIITIYIKKENVTMAQIDEMIEKCGLSKENNVMFADVLVASQKLIDAGKAPVREPISKPKTIRATRLSYVGNGIDSWSMKEVTTKAIKEELEGFYLNTFKNRPILSDKLKNDYPEFHKLVEDARTDNLGLSYLIDFLDTFGGKSDSKAMVYSGNEKNFKKTNLVNLEDYIIGMIKEIKYNNAWHALYRRTKTYVSVYTNDMYTTRIIKNLDYITGNVKPLSNNMGEHYKEALELLEEKYLPFEQWFYKENHPIMEAYNKYKTYGNNDYTHLFKDCKIRIYDKKRLKAIGEYLDVEFDFFDADSVFNNLSDKYDFNRLNSSTDYRYRYSDSGKEVLNEFRREVKRINQKDYLEETAGFLNDLGIKPPEPVYDPAEDDESENDTAINKHDSSMSENSEVPDVVNDTEYQRLVEVLSDDEEDTKLVAE